MKRCLAALLLVTMTMMMNCGLGRAEETVFPADKPFADRAAEEAHLRANRAVHDRYLFEPDLYVCAMTVQKNGDRLFEYRWQYSPTAIFSVNVAKDSESLYPFFNAEFSFENYFDELVRVFDGLFGDWTLEQKAWLSSKVEEYWQMEVFRTYYLDSGNAPFKTVLFKRLLDEQRCGLPDESAVPQDEAYALAVQYAENDPQMSRQETWWKIQTFYLVNDPEKPVWLFRFFSRMNEFYDVTVDAHSREILMQKGEI